jgi:glyoxylase I family protein
METATVVGAASASQRRVTKRGCKPTICMAGGRVRSSRTIAATMLLRIHHAAIICSDYEVSKRFYTQVLGLPVLAEHWRAERCSWKLDLGLPDGSQIELFSFEDRPARPSYPEARGLRHLAFAVADVAQAKADLEAHGVTVEAIRVDAYTGRRFTFFSDPDDLPLELYESPPA